MNQVHGDAVAVLHGAAERPPGTGVDAMVTAVPGLALAVLVADCVPVLLADVTAGVVAAVHAGRPGLRNGIAMRALDAMSALGADPAAVVAWLGPSVCPACYEVPEQMRADVAQSAPAAWSTTASGTAALDLRAGLTQALAGAGVSVRRVGPCTAQSPDHFSYRRDGSTGRFAGIVWLDGA
jgi:YfiH family protein